MTTKRTSNSFSLLRNIKKSKVEINSKKLKSVQESTAKKEGSEDGNGNGKNGETTAQAALSTAHTAREKEISKSSIIRLCASADSLAPGARSDLHILEISSNLLLLKLDLKSCSSIAFKGAVEMAVLYGSVEILGHFFNPAKQSSFLKIYSPSSESLLSINLHKSSVKQKSAKATPAGSFAFISFFEYLKDEDKVEQAKAVFDEWILQDTQCAILLLKQTGCGLNGIETMMPIFRSLFSPSSSYEKALLTGFSIVNHGDSFATMQNRNGADQEPILYPELKINSDYLSKLKVFGTSSLVGRGQGGGSIHCIVGAKNSGKSTMTRHLLNSILNRQSQVAYLDCDVGQPEFTPQGLVSLSLLSEPLLGPPCSHLRIPEHARFLGSPSAKGDPDEYMALLMELFHVYQEKYRHVELVVNTSGWIRGVGFDLLCHFLQILCPTNLIVLQEDERAGLAESLQQALVPKRVEANDGDRERGDFGKINIIQLHQTVLAEEQVSRRIKLNAADQRNLNLISYFMQAPPSSSSALSSHNGIQQQSQAWDFKTPLTARVPYAVPLSAISLKFLNTQVPFSQIFYALNGSIVGLVVDATQYHPHSDSAAIEEVFCKIVPTHTPLLQSNCLGLGLVRAIDLSNNTLYLSTPVPLSMMSRVSLLVRGSSALECPVALLTHTVALGHDAGSPSAQKRKGMGRKDVMGVPYTTSLGAEGVGSTEFKTRHLGRKRIQ